MRTIDQIEVTGVGWLADSRIQAPMSDRQGGNGGKWELDGKGFVLRDGVQVIDLTMAFDDTDQPMTPAELLHFRDLVESANRGVAEKPAKLVPTARHDLAADRFARVWVNDNFDFSIESPCEACFAAARDGFIAGSESISKPPPRTVNVRVAVAVLPDGSWQCEGFDNGKGDRMNSEGYLRSRHGADGVRISFVTANVPLPELTTPPVEIAGKVER